MKYKAKRLSLFLYQVKSNIVQPSMWAMVDHDRSQSSFLTFQDIWGSRINSSMHMNKFLK